MNNSGDPDFNIVFFPGRKTPDGQTIPEKMQRELSIKFLRCFGAMARRLGYAKEKRILAWSKEESWTSDFLTMILQRVLNTRSQHAANLALANEMGGAFHSWLFSKYPDEFIRPWGSIIATATGIELNSHVQVK